MACVDFVISGPGWQIGSTYQPICTADCMLFREALRKWGNEESLPTVSFAFDTIKTSI
jgi:hypothetical protein